MFLGSRSTEAKWVLLPSHHHGIDSVLFSGGLCRKLENDR